MKKFEAKLTGIVIALIIIALIIPTQVLGTNEEEIQIQMILSNDGDYTIYVKDLAKYKYAISDNPDASDMDLSFINSGEDQEGNTAAIITRAEVESLGTDIYLYIKTETEVVSKALNLTQALDEEKVQEVEATTSRIETSVISEVIQNEEIDGVQKKVTVGGLKIENEENATYYYTRTKLPTEQYSDLMNLALKLQSEEFENLSMYEKIKTEKEFYDLYTTLKGQQEWLEVQDMKILQPEDAVIGNQYVVFLKSVNEDGVETVDVKFMVANREEDEGKDQIETTRTVKETTELPITGDSIILFVILAIIVLVAIIVFVRMKKLQNKKAEK